MRSDAIAFVADSTSSTVFSTSAASPVAAIDRESAASAIALP